MTFASAIKKRIDLDDGRKMTAGTYTNGAGDIGGDVITGLTHVSMMDIQPLAASVIAASNAAVNETIAADAPVDGEAVTIVTSDSEVGWWIAIGW